MSRGLGKLQREILRVFESDHAFTISEIGAQTHESTITRAEYECIRRALKSLERKGLVGPLFWGSGGMWANAATVDHLFQKFCEVMARVEARKCRKEEAPTLNPADKSCVGGESNTYAEGSVEVEGRDHA